MTWICTKLGRGSYVNMNVIPIPSPGLGRLRVGGLVSHVDILCSILLAVSYLFSDIYLALRVRACGCLVHEFGQFWLQLC